MPDLNGVVIATPVKTHHPIAKEFLDQGKHVFIEKPLTHSYDTALDLVKLAETKTESAHGGPYVRIYGSGQ